MTEQVEFTEPHSTLEVANRTSIEGGLELDHATNAPELDKAAYAPQVIFDPSLEMVSDWMNKAAFDQEPNIPIDHSLPEVVKKSDDGLQAVDEFESSHKRHLFGLSRKVETSIFIFLIASVLAAVGVGIGVGVTNKHTPSPPPPSIATQTNASRYIHHEYIFTPPPQA